MAQFFPKSIIPNKLARFSSPHFPSLWEDFEDEMENMGLEQTGLSLSEDDDNVYVVAKMPGLNLDTDIDVTLDNSILRIEGSKKEEKEETTKKNLRYHRKASYSYSYRTTLPSQTDENNPEATYVNGELKITFKKLPGRKGKKINVKKG